MSAVAESISWPKDFQELKVIDRLLRCGICYEYLRTCLVTPCSHNYCSFCIRKSMQYKTQCPMCFKETFEVNLQNNRVLDEVVENFTGIRDKLIRHLRIAEVHLSVQQANHVSVPPDIDMTPVKIQTEVGKTNTGKGNPLKLKTPHSEKKKSIDSKSKNTTTKTDTKKKSISFQRNPLVITSEHDNDGNDNSDHEAEDYNVADKENNNFSPQKTPAKEKANGVVIPEIFLQPISPKKKSIKSKELEDVFTVPCPVCSVQIPERNINVHLDGCLYRSERPVRKQTKPDKKRTPLPKLVYNMMSEKDLRKKLKEHGLDQKGDKKTLISRLQRFTVLYNSECDAIEPRPVSALIQEIEKEEKDEKKQQPHRPVINRNTDPKIIEEENLKYRQENKNSFATLIKSLHEREGKKPKELMIIDDDDDEGGGSNNNDICDNKKENMIVIKESVRHNIFSSVPSTSKDCTSAQYKQDIETVDESSDEESITPCYTPPESIKNNNESISIDDDSEDDAQNKYTAVETKTPTETEKITFNTQKLSDEDLGIHNDVSSDVNSVYQASDSGEEEEANSSDNESISLLATVNEENLNDELPNGKLPNADGGGGDDKDDDDVSIDKNVNNLNSQFGDPDFVLTTQDLEEEENTEEFSQSRRKAKVIPVQNSKQKVITYVLPNGKLPNADGGGSDDKDDDDFSIDKNVNNLNSQFGDPDFVLTTQDLEEEENTEEFSQPRRKAKVTPVQNSKRKVITYVLPNGKLPNADGGGGDDDDDSIDKNVNNLNSQIDDPDFVLTTQDLEEDENTEEFFQPKRKAKVTPAQNSKRKVIRAIFTDSDDSGNENCGYHEHSKNSEINTPRRSLRKRVKH